MRGSEPVSVDTKIATQSDKRVRVLYSFPHKLGAARICYTAWQQVEGLAAAGADMLVFPGVLHKPVSAGVKVRPTLAWQGMRIPYKLLGSLRAFALHDWIVARRLEKLVGKVDIVHTWALGAIETLKTARRLGIPTVLERPNAHTRFAMEIVRQECERLGVALPPGHEHAYNEEILRKEEEEYELADRLLCPSAFVVKTFLDKGFDETRLVRHQYGYDEKVYYPEVRAQDPQRGLTMLFVGVCAVRKGVHYALEAWLNSTAHQKGKFLIAGEFLPAYAEKLAPMLAHPSVQVLGHRNDVPELMRKSDILILPSIEEGYPLVIAEAMGSGCVALASEACSEICRHMDTGLVHAVGDVNTLTGQISLLNDNRKLLETLREGCLRVLPQITWAAAGVQLLEAYRGVIAQASGRMSVRDKSLV
jgi:glycosyltransferase involved in cell wall biosynthesis